MPRFNLDNVASHIEFMEHRAKAKTFTRRDGTVADIVEFLGLGNARTCFLDYSHDAVMPELKAYGTLKLGYAPVILDANGKTIREKVIENGKEVWRTKRGAPLTQEELDRKNAQIAAKTAQELKPIAMAAHMIEAYGGDLPALKAAFRLQKWGPKRGNTATAEADAEGDDYGADEPTGTDARGYLSEYIASAGKVSGGAPKM